MFEELRAQSFVVVFTPITPMASRSLRSTHLVTHQGMTLFGRVTGHVHEAPRDTETSLRVRNERRRWGSWVMFVCRSFVLDYLRTERGPLAIGAGWCPNQSSIFDPAADLRTCITARCLLLGGVHICNIKRQDVSRQPPSLCCLRNREAYLPQKQSRTSIPLPPVPLQLASTNYQ